MADSAVVELAEAPLMAAASSSSTPLPSSSSAARKGIVNEGDYVVLHSSDNKWSVHKITATTSEKIGKKHVKLAPLIGAPHGSLFDVLDGVLVRRATKPEDAEAIVEAEALDSPEADSPESHTKNNLLRDDNTAQTLSAEEILKMKESGIAGRDLIRAQVENSKSFNLKSTFSKDKYVKRKQSKYMIYFTVLPPTAANLLQTFFFKNPSKILDMRIDALSTLLTQANARANCRSMVMDGVGGLVLGAVAERMNGNGTLLNVFAGPQPAIHMFLLMNFTASQIRNLMNVPIAALMTEEEIEQSEPKCIYPWMLPRDAMEEALAKEAKKESKAAAAAAAAAAPATVEAEAQASKAEDQEMDSAGAPAEGGLGEKRKREPGYVSKKERREIEGPSAGSVAMKMTKLQESRDYLAANLCDNLVIAVQSEPMESFELGWPFLAPSGCFSIYCQFIEPLARLYYLLRGSSHAVKLQLSETWMREYQVLPGRTHPMMMTSGASGYVLSGVKVISE